MITRLKRRNNIRPITGQVNEFNFAGSHVSHQRKIRDTIWSDRDRGLFANATKAREREMAEKFARRPLPFPPPPTLIVIVH